MPEDKNEVKYTINLDTGGTFTDCVVAGNDGSVYRGKWSTTPSDLTDCFMNVIQYVAEAQVGCSIEELLSRTTSVKYGTTQGTNSLIMRSGPKLGMITTKGFEDTLFIQRAKGRVDGLDILDYKHQLRCQKPVPLISRDMIIGVQERIDCFGNVVFPLRDWEVENAGKCLAEMGSQGIVVMLLWSNMNSEHERKVRDIIRKVIPKDVWITLSSDVSPRMREYPRANTSVIDSYLYPTMTSYLEKVQGLLTGKSYPHTLLVMKSTGGVEPYRRVKAAETLDSGPVAGLIGTKYIGELIGEKNICGTDVGGTSFDVALIADGMPYIVEEPITARFRIQIPRLETQSIGAGGGTISYIDEISGLLKVGPVSAGAVPGPACYGLGNDRPTVTDADVVLGFINPDNFLGGRMKLKKELAFNAVKKISDPLGMTVQEGASAIRRLADGMMGDLIVGRIVAKGLDPSDFTMLAYGGAGPTHCAGYFRETGGRRLLVPDRASCFSAFGAGVNDLVFNYPQSLRARWFYANEYLEDNSERYNNIFQTLEETARKEFAEEGHKGLDITFEYRVFMKYGTQLWECMTISPVRRLTSKEDVKKLCEAFRARYTELYGEEAAYPKGGIESELVELIATVRTEKPRLAPKTKKSADSSRALLVGKRIAFFEEGDGEMETGIYDFGRLECGNQISGPAIIESVDTTYVIPPDFRAVMDQFDNIEFFLE